MIVVGIGCRKHATVDAIVTLIEAVLAEAGLSRPDRIAAPDFKVAEPGLAEAALRLGCDLVWVAEASIAAQQPQCLTRSNQTEIHTGHASIAEACALAGAGGAAPRLVIPRRSNATVTCALATGEFRQ